MKYIFCKKSCFLLLCILLFFCLSGEGAPMPPLKERIKKWDGEAPTQWGEQVTGVATKIKAEGKEIALTFDACGGPKGSAVDWELLDFLRKEKISATLFFSGRWLAKNGNAARIFAADPLFEIENHGTNHRPLSVTGKSAYGISGTASPLEAAMEIEENAETLERITGVRPRFFRSGTNHYDEIAVSIAAELGYAVIGYFLNGDGGAAFSKKRIAEGLLSLRGGEIVLFHMNRPEGWTAEGIKEALPRLREKGFRFVHLSERPLIFCPPSP